MIGTSRETVTRLFADMKKHQIVHESHRQRDWSSFIVAPVGGNRALDQNTESRNPSQMKMSLTHEEIGQMIGTSRETVSRLFAGFKKQHLIQQSGSTLVIPNRLALESLITA